MSGYPQALAAVAVVVIPALLMVSTIRFRSFKTINLGWGRSYRPLWIFAVLIVLVATEPRIALVVLAYGYLLSAFVELAVTRYRARRDGPPAAASP